MTALLDPEARELLSQMAKRPGPPLSELTGAAVREQDLEVLELQRDPGPLHSVDDVEIPGPSAPLSVRIYRPAAGPLPVVLYLHGGGFVIGRAGYDAPLRELALNSGCLVVTPELRLAPEHPFPAPLEDALAVARWVREARLAPGADPAKFVVAGDSSGGNLAAALTHSLTRGGFQPSGQVLIYPMLDATGSSASYDELGEGYGFTAAKSRWYFDRYLPPDVDRSSPAASPLFQDDLSGLPPTLIATAECDPLRDDGERYADALRGAKVEAELRRYPGMIHGFFQMTGALEGARQLHTDLAGWLARMGGRP